MRTILFIIIIGLMSIGFSMCFRIRLYRNVKIRRKFLEFGSKINMTVSELDMTIRCISYVSIFLIGSSITVSMYRGNQNLLSNVFITEFGIVNSIAGVIIAILACSTVVFTLWALVVYGIMAIDINEAFNKLNFLKKKDEIKIYTTVIRPVGFVFIDVFVYYFIPYRITENQFNINNMWISFIWCLFFCFSKIMIYRTKEPRALIGTWYISVYIIGVLLLGVTENFITLMVYLLFFNSLWVFKE